jgi:hypothetical protein
VVGLPGQGPWNDNKINRAVTKQGCSIALNGSVARVFKQTYQVARRGFVALASGGVGVGVEVAFELARVRGRHVDLDGCLLRLGVGASGETGCCEEGRKLHTQERRVDGSLVLDPKIAKRTIYKTRGPSFSLEVGGRRGVLLVGVLK